MESPSVNKQSQAAEAMINDAGGSVWVVLDVDLVRGRALFITRDIIAQKPYHQDFVAITWEGCSLRKWLNTEFYDSLPGGVKSRVIEVTNRNPVNKQDNTAGKPTRDRTFLLSLDEVKQYFKSDAARVVRFNGVTSWWWLRSHGGDRDQRSAAFVDNHGHVYDYGYSVHHDSGVRPALFLKLDA